MQKFFFFKPQENKSIHSFKKAIVDLININSIVIQKNCGDRLSDFEEKVHLVNM